MAVRRLLESFQSPLCRRGVIFLQPHSEWKRLHMKLGQFFIAALAALSCSALAGGAGHSQSSSSDTVKQAQRKLNDQGLNAGQPDGKVGPQTQKAVKEFQQSKGIETSGKLDQQ